MLKVSLILTLLVVALVSSSVKVVLLVEPSQQVLVFITVLENF